MSDNRRRLIFSYTTHFAIHVPNITTKHGQAAPKKFLAEKYLKEYKMDKDVCKNMLIFFKLACICKVCTNFYIVIAEVFLEDYLMENTDRQWENRKIWMSNLSSRRLVVGYIIHIIIIVT